MFNFSYIIIEGNVIKLMVLMKNYYKIMIICIDKVFYIGFKIILYIIISLENVVKFFVR